MTDDMVRRIAANPQYLKLKASRTRFGWTQTALMLIVYYGFILLVAFDKPLLARQLGSGVLTLGMPMGFGVIVFTIAITALYVQRANAVFDALCEDIAKDVRQ